MSFADVEKELNALAVKVTSDGVHHADHISLVNLLSCYFGNGQVC